MRSLSVARRVALLLLAMATVPVAAASASTYLRGRALLGDGAEQLLVARADALASEIDRFIEGRLATARFLAAIPAMSDRLERADAPDGAALGIDALFTQVIERDGLATGVVLVDVAGEIVGSDNASLVGVDLSRRPIVQRTLRGETAVSDVYRAQAVPDQLPVIIFGAPVFAGANRADRTVLGAILVAVPADNFWSLVGSATGSAGQGSFAVVVDPIGVRIAHATRPDLVFRPTGPVSESAIEEALAWGRFGERTRELLSNPLPAAHFYRRAVAHNLGAEPTVERWILPTNDEANLSVAKRLSTAPWTVFVQVPESTVTGAARELLASTLWAASLLSVAAALLGWLMTRGMLGRMRTLARATDVFARGRPLPVPDLGTDEIGDLGRRFNVVAGAVTARTDELERVNAELRKQGDEVAEQDRVLRTQHEELERRSHQLERADRLKSEFLANMSHELRTPLNSVIGFSELVAEEATLEPQHRKFLGDVIASARHLLLLINDILDLSKIESGHVTVDLVAVNPRDAMAEAAELVQAGALKKRITIKTEVETARAVHADPDKLRQVLLNLLSNALKFTPQGGNVRVRAVDEGRLLAFFVEDEGPGVDEALRPQLFSPFVQGEGHLVKKHQGTGLGLAICKRLVELHGGTIAVESIEPHGARFRFTMPAVSAQMVPQADTPLVLVTSNGGTRALVGLIVGAGNRVHAVAPGDDPFSLAARLNPAAIVIDSGCEKCDGTSLLDRLKRSQETHDIPIVLTAMPTACFLAKPLDAGRLLCRLRLGGPPPAEVLVIDADPTLGLQLAQMLASTGYRVRLAATGAEGLAEARRQAPDSLLVNMVLPDRTGFDVVDALRDDPALGDLPLVVLLDEGITAENRARIAARAHAIASTGRASADDILAALDRAIRRDARLVAQGKQTILVADDHDLNRELARNVLERSGYRVLLAADGLEAVRVARAEHPDLVLMDLAMPGMDGFEATRMLASDPTTRDIQVIALTAMALPSDEQRAYEAGVSGFLTKPIERAALEVAVARALRQRSPRRDADGTGAPSA